MSGVTQVQLTRRQMRWRSACTRRCQISWEQWVNIADEAGMRRAADIVDAVLRGIVGPVR